MADPTSTFFDGLLGVHDFQVNGGSLLPRRNTIDVRSGRAEDVAGVTRLTIATAPGWLATIVLSGDVNDLTATDFADKSDISFDPTGATRTITGFDSTALTVEKKRLWNFTTDNRDFVIAHNDSGSLAANRVLTPDGLDMTVTSIQVVSIQRSADGLNWRAYRCSI